MTEQAPGLLGSCIIVPDEGLFLHNQRLGLIEPREKTNWNPEYFAEAFNLRSLRDGLSASCSGATVRHTSPKRILSEVIPYCDDQSELQRAADELAEVNKKVRELIAGKTEPLKNLDNLRQSLLQRAFSGGL
ncbi:hypothetical protein, partial [Roseovarius sp. CH_XMU1461]|uniref:hypothetical protein n=1 Tax=Roseovarius sp. CH_XMU1461 TaxID=3107777 RepID=UPI0030087879